MLREHKKYQKENIVLCLVISALILTILSSPALAQISILNDIDIPPDIEENNDLSATFYAETDLDANIAYEIYMNNVLVSNSNEFNKFMDYASAGTYNFTFFASDNESNESRTSVVDVLNVPMALTLSSPTGRTYNTKTIGIELGVSTYADSCLYNISGPGGWNDSEILIGSEQNFYGSLTLPSDGTYSFNATCFNEYDSSSTSTVFNVDTINPVILSKSYSIDASNTITLSVSTDAICTCKYDTSDKSYDAMSGIFRYSNSLQHSTAITGMPDGYYTYYIKCRNYNNMISNPETIAFSIITRPYASITLSKSPPLKAGTYEVKLTTSKPVISAPSLYYTFDADTTPRYVTLTGSGKDWTGYMIIGDDSPDKVGTFHYTATDFNNNLGNIIREGELFLVDTIKPEAPTSIDAEEMSDGRIKLRWYYDAEEVKRYNVYRTAGDDPDYVDYIDSTTSTQYVDTDVVDGIIYYYRIAAVDYADNDGLLSGVLQATSTRIATSNDYTNTDSTSLFNTLSGQTLDIKLIPKVDSVTAELNKYLLDIDPIKSELSSINDPNKLKIISTLDLIEDINTAKSKIMTLIGEAENLKSKNIAVSELDVQLNKIRMDAIKAKSLVAEDIIVVEQSSFDQITQESDVDAAITELVTVNLSRKVLNNYSIANKQLQDYISVKTDIVIFKIKYLGKDDYNKYTLVKKVVSSSKEFKDLAIIETIPKNFERKASDISFDIDEQQKPVIVNDDPVLRWDVESLGSKTLYYMTNNNAELSSAKGVMTIVLFKPNFNVTQTMQGEGGENEGSGLGNIITGFVSVESVDFSGISIIQWMVFLGIGMILGLSAYYVALDKKSRKYAAQRLKDHKIITKSLNRPLESNDVVALKTPTLGGIHAAVAAPKTMPKTSVNISEIKGSSQRSNISQISVGSINASLDRINDMINSFDYENSRALFNQCLQQYKSASFKNVEEKNTIKLMIDHLYLKMMAYKTIYDSRKHVLAKNYILLKKDKDLITRIYSRLYNSLSMVDDDHKDSERKFLNYIANSNKHLENIKT